MRENCMYGSMRDSRRVGGHDISIVFDCEVNCKSGESIF